MKIELMKLKAELKVLATEIRTLKSKRKELKGYVPGLGHAQNEFRIKHIARCMLRGRTLEQIEPKLRDPNDYNHTYVRKQAAKLVSEILNPKPVEPVQEQPKIEAVAVSTENKESLWNKVTNFLS